MLEDVIAPQLHDYISFHVEGPLAAMCQRGRLTSMIPFEPTFVGRHWSATEEFDIVALDSQRSKAWVAEVKWSERAVPCSLLADLEKRVAACEALRGLEITPCLISRSGFRGDRRPNDVLIDLSVI